MLHQYVSMATVTGRASSYIIFQTGCVDFFGEVYRYLLRSMLRIIYMKACSLLLNMVPLTSYLDFMRNCQVVFRRILCSIMGISIAG